MTGHPPRTFAQSLPSLITGAIRAYGYASRHPEDADGIAIAHDRLISAIADVLNPEPIQSDDYQHAFNAGRKRAASWFAQHGHSLAVYRDRQRAVYASALHAGGGAPVFTGFDAGFSAGLADFIAGVHHG